MYANLELLLGAYLHLDFKLEYGTADDAVRGFAEGEPESVAGAVDDIERLLATGLDEDGLRESLYALGSGYRVEGDGFTPRSWLEHARELLRTELTERVEFWIRLTPTAFTRTEEGLVAGPVWVHLAGEAFPEPDRTDYPLLLLTEWLSRAASIDDQVTLSYLDSPDELRLTRPDVSSPWTVTAHRKTGTPGPTLTMPADTLVTRIWQAGATAASACRSFGWSTGDLEALVATLNVLRR